MTAGARVYGYSLVGYDVAPRPGVPDDLLDATNATYFPTGTADANGGIDLAAINGLGSRAVVPEPSTWMRLGLGALGIVVRTLQRRRARLV